MVSFPCTCFFMFCLLCFHILYNFQTYVILFVYSVILDRHINTDDVKVCIEIFDIKSKF